MEIGIVHSIASQVHQGYLMRTHECLYATDLQVHILEYSIQVLRAIDEMRDDKPIAGNHVRRKALLRTGSLAASACKSESIT